MTSQLVIFRAFLFIFFRPPDPRSEKKNSRKSSNKKNLALYAIYSHYMQFRIKSNIRYADELQCISLMSAIDVYDYVKHFNLK